MGVFGIFEKKNNKIINTSEKDIYDYKPLEPIDINIEAALNNPNPGLCEYCEKVAYIKLHEVFRYHSYKDGSGGVLLRRNLLNPSDIVWLCYSKDLICVFNDVLFMASSSSQRQQTSVTVLDIFTGEQKVFNWFGKGRIHRVINGYGKTFCQDRIEKMYVEGNTLIIDVVRMKNEDVNENIDEYDYDTSYKIEVSFNGEEYEAVSLFPKDINVESDVNSADYGVSINNPICFTSNILAHAFFSTLRTSTGEELHWIREKNANTIKFKDKAARMYKYNLYIKGSEYCNFYVCVCDKNTFAIPNGFILCGDTELTKFNGNLIKEAESAGLTPSQYLHVTMLNYNDSDSN